jgi:hypothetical protein
MPIRPERYFLFVRTLFVRFPIPGNDLVHFRGLDKWWTDDDGPVTSTFPRMGTLLICKCLVMSMLRRKYRIMRNLTVTLRQTSMYRSRLRLGSTVAEPGSR